MLLLEEARKSGERELTAYQTIPTDNAFLAGHFPGFPLWPGALLLEAMAQATAVYLLESRQGLQDDEIPVLGAVDCRFLHPVFPGERICYRAELIRQVGDLGLFSVTASRDSEVVARGRISAGLTRRSALSNPSS
jgi:3-hydroxyacyl-[acyl-carrier-protein] dehydratase